MSDLEVEKTCERYTHFVIYPSAVTHIRYEVYERYNILYG